MKFDRELPIKDFYKPSNEMKEYKNISLGLITFGSGYTFISFYITNNTFELLSKQNIWNEKC